MAKPTQVSERVVISETNGSAEIVIYGKMARWKQSVLLAWWMAWLFCGAVVLAEVISAEDRNLRLMLMVFLAFWAYYLWKIGNVLNYRMKGFERITLINGELRVARKLWGKPREARYFTANISALKQIEIPQRSLAFTYENLWWVLGGERVGFDYGGKLVRFAMQINDQETAAVLRFIKKGVPKYRENRS